MERRNAYGGPYGGSMREDTSEFSGEEEYFSGGGGGKVTFSDFFLA